MQNIYSLAYDTLLEASIACITKKKGFPSLVEFLTTLDSDLDDLILKRTASLNIDKNFFKAVMMLTFCSCAYLNSSYDVRREVNVEEAEMLRDYLECMAPQEIILLFFKNDFILEVLYESFYNYVNNTYIYRYCCWANIQNENKTKKLLNINPFVILETDTALLDKGFTQTELTIQLFYDLYDKALEESSEDTEYTEEEDENIFNKLIIKNFRRLISNHFKDNENEIANFYSMILGIVYENLILHTEKKKRYQKQRLNLIRKLEEYSPEDLICLLQTDDKFTSDIINLFISYNDFLEKSEFIARRRNFIKRGDSNKLKEFNPYFDEEVQLLKRLK